MNSSTPPNSELTRTVTFDEALQIATRLHREFQLEPARDLYEQLLAAAPDHPDVLHFYGILKHQMGASEAGIDLIRRAIALAPGYADFHVNLGNILVQRGRIDEGEHEYQEALKLRPDSSLAWNNLGSIHRNRNRLDEAEAAYRKALELEPDMVGAHNNIGRIYWDQQDFEASTRHFCRAIGIDPQDPTGHKLLGMVYYTRGMHDKAAEAFKRWIDADPDNPAAHHHYAACRGEDVPDRASDDYVRYTFDRFALSFEDQLQSKLHYRAPALLAQAFAGRLGPPDKQYDILDAGCGTGLCGPLMAPWARRQEGVDLSGGMLAQAQAKQCYDLLEEAELTAWLESHPGAYDVIVSADTLCYFGPLEAVTAAALSALRPGGTLGYTVERIVDPQPGETSRLSASGRYQHTADYLAATLRAAGFIHLDIQPAHLRTEGGKPVEGLVTLAQRPA
ncbi:MAG: tetratricopeptide repeat protein [Rhodocyclaceae bacterium]|nr:tetratricopeptide repeat protein [Rhodocyclaceae bacterium]